MLLLVAMLGVLIAIPLAVLVGTHTYAQQLALSDQQHATRHLATATLTEDVVTPTPASDGGAYLGASGPASGGVHAVWTVADGTQKVGTITAEPGTTAGTKVPVWLSASDDPMPAPLTPSDAATTGVLSGIFAWVLTALVLVGLYWLVRLVLDRRRARRWDREWAHIGNRWARS